MEKIKKLLTREDVPGRAWWPFMEKVNKLISGTATKDDIITLDDCPLRIWSPLFEKVNAAILGETEGVQITHADIPNLPTGAQDIWFSGLSIVNKEVFGVSSPASVRKFTVSALYDQSTYEALCPKEYREKYPDHWYGLYGSPWIVIEFDVNTLDSYIGISFKVDGVETAFGETETTPGSEFSEDRKIKYLIAKGIKNYVTFDVRMELATLEWKGKTFEMSLVDADGNVLASASATLPKETFLPVTGKLNSLTAGVITDEESWNKYIPASYAEDYTYEESKASLPWLVINYDKVPEDAKTGVALQIGIGGTTVAFGGNAAEVGTVSEDKHTFTTKKDAGYVMFEINKDLGVAESAGKDVTVLATNCLAPNTAYVKA